MKRVSSILLTALLITGMLAGCEAKKKAGGDTIRLLNVSYDPTREFYREFNDYFASQWQARHGVVLTVEQSHGGSGKQARSVIDGLEADVITLATASDIQAIARLTDLVPEQWQSALPDNSAPYYSTMVFLVRVGNPRGIRDWGDLIQEGVEVITPNPKTSGAARWSYLAARAWAQNEYGNDEERVIQFLVALYANVPVLDSGARGASNTFAQAEIGDVLINWENEATLLVEDIGVGRFEKVVPSISVLAEPPVAVVEGVARRRGTYEVAHAYLELLYTPAAQEMAARHHYRPRDPEVMARFAQKYPAISLVTVDQFGGWSEAQERYFSDGAEFDQVMDLIRRGSK